MTMIERVARAIAKREIGNWTAEERGYQSIDLLVAQTWKDWEDAARDAIEAIREPTSDMLNAPAMKNWLWNDGNPVSDGELRDAWQQMIDAALQEGKETVG